MMKINAIVCPECKDIIFSRTRHDCRGCSCGDTFIDGGFDYVKVGAKNLNKIENKTLFVNTTKEELYNDWNKGINQFGLVKGMNVKPKNKRIREKTKQKNKKKC